MRESLLYQTPFKEEIDLIKPLLFYADRIVLLNATRGKLNALDPDDVESIFGLTQLKEEIDRNRENLFALNCLSGTLKNTKLAMQRMTTDLNILTQLINAGVVRDFSYLDTINFLNNADNREEIAKIFADASEEIIIDVLFLAAMILHVFAGIPIYSSYAYELLRDCEKITYERQMTTNITTSPTPSAHLFNYLTLKLPNFENTPIDEILDIRRELEKPLVRFRSKILKYSDDIKYIPNDHHIEEVCNELYMKEIAPALLEIEELTKETSFVKNLGFKLFSDEGLWNKGLGGLTFGLMLPGALAAMSQSIPLGISAMIPSMIPTTSKVASKIVQTAKERGDKKKAVEGNDLYFLYEAGRKLKK